MGKMTWAIRVEELMTSEGRIQNKGWLIQRQIHSREARGRGRAWNGGKAFLCLIVDPMMLAELIRDGVSPQHQTSAHTYGQWYRPGLYGLTIVGSIWTSGFLSKIT